MKPEIRLTLRPTAPQDQQLRQLQGRFAEACNELAPLVQQTRCWNRVALHHMAYRPLRERFPDLGSQMVCNAIYSVSRTSRVVYQGRTSPFNVQRLGSRPLPRLVFLPESPVFFDRHTLSIKDKQVSMFTLDGRLRFQLDVTARQEARLRTGRLREIVLQRVDSGFGLDFHFVVDTPAAEGAARPALPATALPQYVVIDESAAALPERAA